jgi:alpha-beta hydrolase superfamily lysophospholipase
MTGTFSFSGADGLSIFVRFWLPEGAPKAAFQIAHGMAEHSARYEHLALKLTASGYAVYANDHRGHGLTIPNGQAPGHLADTNGWKKTISDMVLLNAKIRDQHGDCPIILLGHSMGSFMAQHYMAEHGNTIAAVALSATNGPSGLIGKIGKLVTRIEKFRVGSEGHSSVLSKMTFKAFNKAFAPNRTEFDWLSRDEAEVDKYIDDPLCGFECSVETWIEVLDALTIIASHKMLAKVDKSLPIYVFSGTEDPVGEKTKGVRRLLTAYERQMFKNVSHRFYEAARHELMNETNREEVMLDMIEWSDSVIEELA